MSILSVAAVGECMIELSADGDDLWKSSCAGDTFNTLWTMRVLLPEEARLDYVTAFGDDPFSQKQKEFFRASKIGVAESPTLVGGRPGLYAITLDGFERSFTYWRNNSAACHLADDPKALRRSLAGRDLIYLSGITLAILSPQARQILLEEVSRARALGSTIAFDPNFRSRLWSDADTARHAINHCPSNVDIALPTFDDERALYGDGGPHVTLERIRLAGCTEVIIKCGGEPAHFASGQSIGAIPSHKVEVPVDTTGAGDAFNGGYLAARMSNNSVEASCRAGHRAAAAAIQSRGALTPFSRLSC